MATKVERPTLRDVQLVAVGDLPVGVAHKEGRAWRAVVSLALRRAPLALDRLPFFTYIEAESRSGAESANEALASALERLASELRRSPTYR